MQEFVLDANFVISWLFEKDNASVQNKMEKFDRLCFVVPPLWWLEISNYCLRKERNNTLSTTEIDTALKLIDSLPIQTVDDPFRESIEEIVNFARPYQLSSYDAVYLALAERERLPLCTLDKNLIQAAKRLRLPVWTDV